MAILKITILYDDYQLSKFFCEKYLGKMLGESNANIIGAFFFIKSYRWGSTDFKFQAWLSLPQQRFKALSSVYIKGSLGGMIIVDLTNKDTLMNLQNNIKKLWDTNKKVIPTAIISIKPETQTLESENNKLEKQHNEKEKTEEREPQIKDSLFITELKIPYSNETSIKIFLNELTNEFNLKFCKDDWEIESKTVSSDLDEDQAWELLSNMNIEVVSMATILDVAQDLLKVIKDPKKYIEVAVSTDIAMQPSIDYSGEIEPEIMKYCKELSKKTKDLGFDIRYYSITKNDPEKITPFLDYIAESFLKSR